MIKVVFFARVKEALNCGHYDLEKTDKIKTVADVTKVLVSNNEQWSDILNDEKILTAVNHDMVNTSHAVNDNDEVAYFPPVTGG